MSYFGTDLNSVYNTDISEGSSMMGSSGPKYDPIIHDDESQFVQTMGAGTRGGGNNAYGQQQRVSDMYEERQSQQEDVEMQPQPRPKIRAPPKVHRAVPVQTQEVYPTRVNSAPTVVYGEPSIVDRFVSKRKDVIKLLTFALVIVLGLSLNTFLEFYVRKYVSFNDVPYKKELMIRGFYPTIVFLAIWSFKVFNK